MEQEKAYMLIENNLNKIFAYSLSKLQNADKAEELTSDVIYQILKSLPNLKDDDAFYGFMWRIADNTFKKYLRKKNVFDTELDDSIMYGNYISIEEEIIESEDLNTLRRELSLLSKEYRKVCVDYYINSKSCQQIANEMNLSVEMVKYYLFKTRKILKEGINMERKFGERSYNPSVFKIDYWGNETGEIYRKMFSRKLPANIIVSAYNNPLSLTELSVELGVSTVYLEDEIDILLRHGMLKKVGNKYQADIFIFTDAFENEMVNAIKPFCKKISEDLCDKLDSLISKIKKVGFEKIIDFNDEYLKWTAMTIFAFSAIVKCECETNEIFGGYELLSNGSYGMVYAHDTEENKFFDGMYGWCNNQENTASFTAYNFKFLREYQQFEVSDFYKTVETLCDVILKKDIENEILFDLIENKIVTSKDGNLNANFPIFSRNDFEKIQQIIENDCEEFYKALSECYKLSFEIFKKHKPNGLGNRFDKISYVYGSLDAVSLIFESLLNDKVVKLIPENRNVCMFGVVE